MSDVGRIAGNDRDRRAAARPSEGAMLESDSPSSVANAPAGDALARARAAVNEMLHFTQDEIESGEALEFGRRLDAYEAAARAEGAAEEREACAKLAETFSTFTGANYCDERSPEYDPKRHPVHEYGRGGNYVRRGIADAIRARSPSSGTEAP